MPVCTSKWLKLVPSRKIKLVTLTALFVTNQFTLKKIKQLAHMYIFRFVLPLWLKIVQIQPFEGPACRGEIVDRRRGESELDDKQLQPDMRSYSWPEPDPELRWQSRSHCGLQSLASLSGTLVQSMTHTQSYESVTLHT